MRKLLTLWIALAAIVGISASSFGGSMLLLGAGKAGGGGAASPTFTPGSSVAVQFPNFTGSTATFSGLNGGVNFPSGADVYVFFGNDQGGLPSTPLIGGQTATQVTGATDAFPQHCITYHAIMPVSQADTFTIANGNSYASIGVASGYFTGIQSSPIASSNEVIGNQADPQFPSTAIAIPSTGFGFAFMWGFNASFAVTGNNGVWQTATPSFITASGGDTASILNAHGAIFSGHTTSALAGGTSWQPKVSGATSGYPFAACMGAVAVGP